MKYYETTLQEYVDKVEKLNIHGDHELLNELQKKTTIENMIFYGQTGVGKYSQVLYLLSRVLGKFKPQQKLCVQKDIKKKYTYTYIMSDIYFEIDVGLLGCNSKSLWHEIYLQIIDIILIHPKKMGIIVCKNFHLIHSELLEIFYSYMQENHIGKNIMIKYIIITEHISFIQENILHNFLLVHLPKPSTEIYNKIAPPTRCGVADGAHTNIVNIKDVYVMGKNTKSTMIIICNNIIHQIEKSDNIILAEFRDILYEILIYGLDINECIWYILDYFYKKNILNTQDNEAIVESIYDFLKKYNNNYRPITHLESIFIIFIEYYRRHSLARSP